MNPDPTRSHAAPDTSPADPALAAAFGPDTSDPSGTLCQGEAPPPPTGPAPAAFLGARYAGVAELARGGMGVVYAATDTVLDRPVAVKVLQPRYAADPEAARQFEVEARITGRLQHPGVPPVHDLGTLADGSPFLAMKLIRGRTLADLLRDRPGPSHDLPALLGVFEQVCQTVGYAHAEGVVHRDLKPANVMVGSFAEVQVMDWGIALTRTGETAAPAVDDPTLADHDADPSTDASVRTQGGVIGTPAYMPPEQARGERLDVRADVFALGGILFEILTGEKVYGVGTSPVILHRAANEMLADARAGLAACGADAELVALAERCLAVRPDDRPADGKAVGDAVAAYRAGVEERLRAAEAERVAADARAAEHRKRRRLRLALAAAVGLLLLGGAAVAAQRHVERKERAAREETAGDAWLTRCVEALRGDDAEAAAAALKEAEARLTGAARFAPQLDRCRADVALLQELDRIDDLQWLVKGNKLQHRQAPAEWREAFRRFGVSPDSPADGARAVGASLIRDRAVAALDHWLGLDPSPGLLDFLHAADPDPYRDAIRGAVRTRDVPRLVKLLNEPGALGLPPRMAVVLGENQSLPSDRRLRILAEAHRKRPGDFLLFMTTGNVYRINRAEGAAERAGCYLAAVAVRPGSHVAWLNLGVARKDSGDVDGAIVAYREAIRLQPDGARARVNLGVALRDKRQLAEAEAEVREGIRLDPTDAWAHGNLGVVLTDRKDWPGAEAALAEAIRLAPDHVLFHSNLGACRVARGDLKGAEAPYREAVRLDPDEPAAHDGLGATLGRLNRLDEAIPCFEAAIRLNPRNSQYHFRLALARQFKGELPAAAAAYRASIRLDPTYAPAHFNLGNTLDAAGDADGALAAWREAARRNPADADSHVNVSAGLADRGDWAGAEQAARAAVRAGPANPRGHANLAVAQFHLWQLDEAERSAREAIRLQPTFAVAHKFLGDALRARADVRAAEAAYREAARLNPKSFGSLPKEFPLLPLAPPPREVRR